MSRGDSHLLTPQATTAELHRPANAAIEPECDRAVRTRQPHYGERTMYWQHKFYTRYRRILLPLTSGGAAVAILMNVAGYVAE